GASARGCRWFPAGWHRWHSASSGKSPRSWSGPWKAARSGARQRGPGHPPWRPAATAPGTGRYYWNAGMSSSVPSITWGWRRDDPARIGVVRCWNDPGHVHGFNQARRPIVTNLELALQGRNGRLARLGDEPHGFVVQGVIFLAVAASAVKSAAATFIGTVQNVLDIIRLAALLPFVHQTVHLIVRDEGAVYAHRQTGSRRHVEHVPVPQPLLGTALIKN